MPYSSFLKKGKKKRDFDIIKVGLERPRDELYRRINQRVDEMVKLGIEDEANSFISSENLTLSTVLDTKNFLMPSTGKFQVKKQ